MSSKKKQFQVSAVITGIFSTTIAADSMEDALSRAKNMKITDFIKPVDQFDDGLMEIQSVSRDGWCPEID